MTPEELFLSHLPLIKRVSESVCRRHHCTREEAEDFASTVIVKLMADDFAVFRKFQGKCRLETYLTTVITRLYLDWRNHLWGKWRPSAEAKRLGLVAVKLEELARDGRTFHESCEILRTNHKVALSREELEKLAAKLPPRFQRTMEGEGPLEGMTAGGPRTDEGILEKERRAEGRRVWEALGRAWAKLPDEDRLILKLHYQEGMQVVEVARALHLEEKPFFRRVDRLKKKLREELEGEGIGRELVAEVLDEGK